MQALRKWRKIVQEPYWFQSAVAASVIDRYDTIVRVFPEQEKAIVSNDCTCKLQQDRDSLMSSYLLND